MLKLANDQCTFYALAASGHAGLAVQTQPDAWTAEQFIFEAEVGKPKNFKRIKNPRIQANGTCVAAFAAGEAGRYGCGIYTISPNHLSESVGLRGVCRKLDKLIGFV